MVEEVHHDRTNRAVRCGYFCLHPGARNSPAIRGLKKLISHLSHANQFNHPLGLPCHGSWEASWFGLALLVSYLALFIQLYKDLYVKQPKVCDKAQAGHQVKRKENPSEHKSESDRTHRRR